MTSSRPPEPPEEIDLCDYPEERASDLPWLLLAAGVALIALVVASALCG